MVGKNTEVRQVKRVARAEIGKEEFRLDLKSFVAKDEKVYEFLALERGFIEEDGGERTFTSKKKYTLPIKAAAWLGKVLQENYPE